MLPPKRPDTNVTSVSEEFQIIIIEESISQRAAFSFVQLHED